MCNAKRQATWSWSVLICFAVTKALATDGDPLFIYSNAAQDENVIFRDGVVYLAENRAVTLICAVLSKVPNAPKSLDDVQWWRNGQSVAAAHVNTSANTVSVRAQGDAYAVVNYTCVDSRHPSIGDSVLVVGKAPAKAVAVKPDFIMVSQNMSIELFCNLSDDYTPLNITWLQNDTLLEKSQRVNISQDGRIVTIGSPLLPSDAGIYMCIVEFVHTTSNATSMRSWTNVFGAPFFRDSKPNKTKMRHDRFSVACEPFGHPLPRAVSWFKGDVQVNETGKLFLPHRRILNARMVIDSLEYADGGTYRCEAINAYGNASSTVDLRVKDKLAALWPFLAIVAEVVILLVIIFVLEKRHQRASQREPSQAEMEQKQPLAVANDTYGDVRQRQVAL